MISLVFSYIKNPKLIYVTLSYLGFFKNVSDEKHLKRMYKIILNKNLNLENPQTYNEKMQWLKIHDRKDVYTTMVDKCDAKNYVANIIGKKYIIPTIGIYDSFDNINFDELPNKFVIKCTHDSGGSIICVNKDVFNIKKARKKINKCLKRNYYYWSREWPYKNVKPRIIVEKYMENTDESPLRDYKFFCFDGIPKLMYLSEGLDNHATASMSFYDMDFMLTDCKRSDYKQLDYVADKPKNFDLMKKYAAVLSSGIPHLRVDFYEINGHLYFGELTFSTCSGFLPFENEKWDLKMGNWINIDKCK